jgi:hypothetical protein
MKDLIVIGAYCPDNERENLLNRCVDSIQNIRGDFDIMISSHSIIPEYISQKVDYVFFDKNNKIITDWKYLNQPWFCPDDNITIKSSFVSSISTYLATYKIFLGALGIAKVLNYNTVHWIEYDSIITDFTDLYENHTLIKDYVAIQYKKENRLFEDNIDWGYGCFQTINLNKVTSKMLEYDEDYLLHLLENSVNKTNEKITQDLYQSEGEKIFFKNFDEVLNKGNKFNLSNKTEKDSLDYWALPYYDTKSNKINFLVWNNRNSGPIDVTVIVNNEKIFRFDVVNNYQWYIRTLGVPEEIKNIIVLLNERIKMNLTLNENNLELFKKTSYSEEI